MGNEQSHLTGIEIEEKSVEVSDFWSQHSASVINSENVTNLSVLIGELFVDGPLWSSQTPLEKNNKNLMIYRHPCIVRYISSWNKGSKFYLAVEEVMPLSHVLATQDTLQICIGLHSILKALCFLHEKASVSHNNICTASIYVTKDGNWKLGGMEYLCKFSNLTRDYLRKSRSNRYSKAIDPNEEEYLDKTTRRDIVDVYAFGVLVCEVLKGKTNDEIPCLVDFRDLCKDELQNVSAISRPKLSSLLDNDFFNHEFITIHSFLVELPLKSDEEKTRFFENLVERLRAFPETTVASQFGSLLLSRMVLLNKTAQQDLLPHILCPKLESEEHSGNFFSEETFKKFLVPKLLEIFCVRDAQIRLLLLDHFAHFIHTFTREELQTCILPELLVGVKDTNDHLVSVTLRTLADLVPILGASTVIGGKRAKLFNDGRPIVHSSRRSRKNTKRQEPTQPSVVDQPLINSIQVSQIVDLPERPRPDGEEGETSTEEVEPSVEEDLDNWEDWDMNEPNSVVAENSTAMSTLSLGLDAVGLLANNNSDGVDVGSVVDGNEVTAAVSSVVSKRALVDIAELDIKNQAGSDRNSDDIDFFQDMEPVIETSSKYLIIENQISTNLLDINSKLNVNLGEDVNGDGWVDEEWE